MASQQSNYGASSRKEEDMPWISPMSSMIFDEHAEQPRRMSTFSLQFGSSRTLSESETFAWPSDSRNSTEMKAAGDIAAAHTSTANFREHSYRSSHDNPLGLSHQESQFKIKRVPVPAKRESNISHSSIADSTPDLGKMGTVNEMSSPGDTLIGEPSPRRGSRWGRSWNLHFKGLSRKRYRGESLTMDMEPMAGVESAPRAEEAACDSDTSGSYCPKRCCTDGPELCSSRRDIQSSAWHWLTKVVLTLSLYSTVMSGIWLFVAIVQPRWGRGISSNMGLGPSTATLLAAWLAKTIELTFVTTFITFLGQILTRRAIARGSRGTTLAEMSMRTWVIQPGSLLTHFNMLRFAGLSVLGILSLLATFVAAFYTTASDAMVAPKLKYGNWNHKVMSGYVRASYANAKFVESSCPAMLSDEDPENSASSCTEVMVSGESYRNLQSFMSTWTAIYNNGSTKIDDLKKRPVGVASLNGNTTLFGSWIETEHSNVTAHFEETGRIINNVTLAMPHPGVAAAAINPMNGILQPDDLSGVGEYAIKAGVVSPAVNVLCVNMSPDELKPLVYTGWPNANTSATGVGDQVIGWQNWTDEVPPTWDSEGNEEFLNRTVVDDIFRWGPDYKRRPPVFQLYPAKYNTLVNSSVVLSDAIYILGKSPKMQNYTMCELRSWVSPSCSTQFNISGITGSKMAAHCEDPLDLNSYYHSIEPGQKWPAPDGDWRWLADQWGTASDMNGGQRNSNPSNARIITQLALVLPTLPSYLPSMAEALAVFASATLVLGSVGTPFAHYWDYTKPGNILGEPGAVHQFNASVITQQYTSGHVYNWQGIFYVILALTFVLNILCFVYILSHAQLVTDYTEAHNLFSLALNSAPNERLKGTCGGGPEGRDVAMPWRVGYSSGANHYFIEQADTGSWRRSVERPNTGAKSGHFAGESYNRLRNGRPWL